MNNDNRIKEYFETWKGVKLSEQARTRIQKELATYAKFHSVSEDVRIPEESRSIEQEAQTSASPMGLLMIMKTRMPTIVIALALLVTGGTSFAAQSAVPGDLLYPIKTHVNENVRGTLTVGANAEARFQADLLAERIEEAKTLEAEGRLTGETAAIVSHNIRTQAEATERAAASSDAEVSLATRDLVTLALGQFNALVANDPGLQVESETYLATENGDTSIASMLSIEPMKLSELLADIEARIDSLQEIIDRHKAEFEASVYTRLNAKLTEATELMVSAKTQAEAEARATAERAATLVAEVEAELSTLGTIEVDPETGMIIDIDTSIIPDTEFQGDRIIELDIEGNTTVGGDAQVDPHGADLDSDVEVDTSIESKGIDLDTESSVGASSGISL